MDRLSCSNNFHPGIRGVLLAGCIILIVLSVYSTSLLAFVVFAFAYILVPGMLLVTVCSNDKMQISIQTILSGFFVGLGTLIIEYFLISPFGLRAAFIILNPLVIVLLAANKKFRKSIKSSVDMNFVLDPQMLILFAVVLLITCITQKYSFYDLYQYDSIYLYQDMSWHIGNIASLSRGYPFTDFRFSGLRFNYHYFNDLIFGMCKYCFGTDASALWFKCAPLLSASVFSLGIAALIKRVSHKTILGFTMFILCGGALPYFLLNSRNYYSLINYHIFSNINGVAVSLAAVAAVFLTYCDLYELKEYKKAQYLILAILVFVMTGLKGPFAVVLVAAMMFTSALMLLRDHEFKKAAATAICVFGSFCFTYIIVIKGIDNLLKDSNNNRATAISITGTFARSRLWPVFGQLLNGNKAHLLLYCLCVAILGSIIAAGVYFIFFLGETFSTAIDLTTKKGSIKTDIILSITTGWVGLAGFWLVSHKGFSQAYFLFIAILFVTLEAIRQIENSNGIIKKILVVVIIANTAISGHMYINALSGSIKDDSEHYDYRNAAATYEEPQYLTHAELEGLMWIRENTDKDSVIATDRQALWSLQKPAPDSDCRYFYCSAFAERQVYLEGFSYSDVSEEEVKEKLRTNRDIYSDEPEKAQKAIESCGIDYIIVTKRFGNAPAYLKAPVFTNRDISIYKCS